MRHLLSILVFLIVSSTFLYGQDNILICSKQVSDRTERTNEILQKNGTYISADLVDINVDKILKYEEFLLQIDKRNISIRKERIDARGINNYVFVGSNDEGCRVLISVFGDDIQGVVETVGEVFTIETVGERQYALITVDYSQMREACDNLDEDSVHSSFIENNSQELESDIEDHNDITASPILKSAAANDCKIRVLVLYTPSAKNAKSNIKNTILTAVALTNQSFVNSQINYQIELVYAGQTNYTESGFDTDLSRFRISGDGYMDEVHALRNKYSADICVLLINDCAYCGLATGIKVTEANAFCIVSTCGNCATTNYSFGHEIGHLIGCRHDPYVDLNITPYTYGHGFVYPTNEWRTIMAYVDACGSCPRLLYWSNPHVYYGGTPMGTVVLHDNARVWSERSNTVMAFRQPDNNVTFTSADMPNTEYADVMAKQNITTSGTVNTNIGNTLVMRAGNSIILQPGFSVQAGAEFSARIEDIDDCPDCDSTENKAMVQHVPEVFDDKVDTQIETLSSFSYTVLPDSSNDSISITYSLEKDMSLCIELVDVFGQKLKTILPQQNQKKGNYSLKIPYSDDATGTFFLVMSPNNQRIIEKIIIK